MSGARLRDCTPNDVNVTVEQLLAVTGWRGDASVLSCLSTELEDLNREEDLQDLGVQDYSMCMQNPH